MGKFIDLTGQKFERLSVVKLMFIKNNRAYWQCRCDCNKEKIVRGSHLINGAIKSCGCLGRNNSLKHGHTRNKKQSRTYQIFAGILSRCYNINEPAYKNYGKRGITVCDRWNPKRGGSFENFLKDMGEIPKGLTIDRINNNKLKDGYSPDNCKLSTMKEQARNRRSNVKFTLDNKEKCVSELAEENGIKVSTLLMRINNYGYSIKEALTIPIRKHKKYKKRK
jgi:hypothetical protein